LNNTPQEIPNSYSKSVYNNQYYRVGNWIDNEFQFHDNRIEKGSQFRVNPEDMVVARRYDIIRGLLLDIVLDIEPVNSVTVSVLQRPLREIFHQFIREQNIDIRCKNILSAGTPDAHILPDHLEQLQVLGMR
jgi:hypothetical protein